MRISYGYAMAVSTDSNAGCEVRLRVTFPIVQIATIALGPVVTFTIPRRPLRDRFSARDP